MDRLPVEQHFPQGCEGTAELLKWTLVFVADLMIVHRWVEWNSNLSNYLSMEREEEEKARWT